MVEFEILLVAIITTLACVLPGVFLVLRGMALMSDAISHAALLGIVGIFFWIHHLDSPLFILGASLVGILTVSLTELLIKSNRVKKDAAIGLVFPLFFAIAVIIISRYASDVHLDSDAVLLGELAFTPFDRMLWNGFDLGPKAIWMMGSILGLNTLLITLFYKELKLSTFDPGLATALGILPVWVHYGLMSMTSVTAVGAFDSVGSVLVVALMVTPSSTAYLLTASLRKMIGMSIIIGILSAIIGVFTSLWLDVSIAGAIATVTGLFFILGLIFAPKTGVLSRILLIKKQKISFSLTMLLVQLLDHEGHPSESTENTVSNIITHIKWSKERATKVVQYGVSTGMILRQKDALSLTNLGREVARRDMVQL